MTKEQFDEFVNEIIPQQLFHVEPTDIDDGTGARLDELLLVDLISNNPSCLKHKPLQWFLDTFLIANDEQPTLKQEAEFGNHLQGQIENQMDEEKKLFCQIINDEREGDVCPDCMGAGEVIGSSEIGSATTHQKCFSCRGTGRKKK